ncbi:unnamed protein product [Didymodactylos carnosus]|uniref:Uncharacterized protein n=2 Tax=Didymodactylos carnosus TaxID=1234261 RepID=A0A8S2QZH3_9BILA|nr:unnamed protein product [Didymodactylos carnosus]CAF4129339.1 unnamed protein product [Didymodactylos carnosus]
MCSTLKHSSSVTSKLIRPLLSFTNHNHQLSVARRFMQQFGMSYLKNQHEFRCQTTGLPPRRCSPKKEERNLLSPCPGLSLPHHETPSPTRSEDEIRPWNRWPTTTTLLRNTQPAQIFAREASSNQFFYDDKRSMAGWKTQTLHDDPLLVTPSSNGFPNIEMLKLSDQSLENSGES